MALGLAQWPCDAISSGGPMMVRVEQNKFVLRRL